MLLLAHSPNRGGVILNTEHINQLYTRSKATLATLLCVFICALTTPVSAQTFGDREFYLIDSLDMSKLEQQELALIDSCLKAYHTSSSDTGRLEALNFLVENSWNDNVWPRYNTIMFNLAQTKFNDDPDSELRVHYLTAGANAINNFGYYAQMHLSDIDSAITLYRQSLEIWEEIGDSANMTACFNNLGTCYRELGDLTLSLEYHYKALHYAERNNKPYSAAYQLSNLALVFIEQKDFESALAFSKRSLKLRQEIGDQIGIATSMSTIAGYYNVTAEFDSASYYYEKALVIASQLGNRVSMAIINNNLGTISQKEGNNEMALTYFQKSLEMSESVGDMAGVARTLKNIGVIYWRNGNIEQAKESCERGLQLAQKVGSATGIEINAGLLSQITAKEGNYKDALAYRNLEIQIHDSLADQKAIQAAAQLQARYEYEKKSTRDKATIVRQNLEINERYYQLVVAVGGLLLLALTVGVLFQRLRLTKIQHELTEKKTLSDLSLLISDNKVRHDFDQQLLSRLEKLRRLDANELKRHINRYVFDLKNQLNFEEKQQILTEDIQTLHSTFEKQLKERFPQLTASEIEICHLFKLNKSIKEIASLKNTSEGAIRTSRYRIKSKLGLGKEVSLDDYIKAEI